MLQMQYQSDAPPPLPKVSDLPKFPGNNWEDPAFAKSHTLKQLSTKADSPDKNKHHANARAPTPDFPLAPALTEVYRSAAAGETGLDKAKWLTLDDKVLRFSAFYRETVHDSRETEYVRKVTIYYYPIDDTLMIIEGTVPNSGFQGGTLVKRHKVPLALDNKRRAAADLNASLGASRTQSRIPSDDLIKDKHLNVNYLNVGREVTIYGKTFYIVDCDASTRDFLETLGVSVPMPEGYPNDPYVTQYRAGLDKKNPFRNMTWEDRDLKMANEQSVKGRSVMHYPESIIKTQKFLADDGTVLAFNGVWDDRENPHGDVRMFELRYYVADDTIEVLERLKPNCGRDPTRAFAYRRRLPKEKVAIDLTFSNARGPTGGGSKFYGLQDLYVGAYINVYGRAIHLVGCDPFTRDYYARQGVNLEAPIDVEAEYGLKGRSPAKAMPPPHNKFGTEEDSLGNWKNLVLKPPRVNLKKWMQYDGKVLRFGAKLAKPESTEESERRFIVTYYLGDDTIQVTEMAERNSGMMGGRILKRQKVKKFDGEGPLCYYKWEDLFVGAVVNICGHIFELTHTDGYTRRFRYRVGNIHPAMTPELVEAFLTESGLGTAAELAKMPVSEIIKAAAEKGIGKPDDDTMGGFVLGYLSKYDKDHDGDVLLSEFIQGISCDPMRAIEECLPQEGDSIALLEAKNARKRQIIGYTAAKSIRAVMNAKKMQNHDMFRVISSHPISKFDNAGSHATNSLHAKFNPYQLFMCMQQMGVSYSLEEKEAIEAEFFPTSKKQMALQDFIRIMNKVDEFGGLDPLRVRPSSE